MSRGSDYWMYFDWLALVLILATIVSHALFFYYSTNLSKEIHHYIIMPLLLTLWFRIFKYARPFESAGPFIVIFSSVMGDIAKWAFLNLVLVIPFTCAFWLTFGAISLHPVEGYSEVGPLLYNIFSMMVVGSYGFENLEKVNPFMARLLCGSFIAIAAIVTVNLLIALLSNTFERLYENAISNAAMQRAQTILLLEKSLRQKQKSNYYNYIKEKGSPEIISKTLGGSMVKDNDDATIDQVRDDVKVIIRILEERFGNNLRKGSKKNDLDFVRADVSKALGIQNSILLEVMSLKTSLENMKLQIDQGKIRTTPVTGINSANNVDDSECKQNQEILLNSKASISSDIELHDKDGKEANQIGTNHVNMDRNNKGKDKNGEKIDDQIFQPNFERKLTKVDAQSLTKKGQNDLQKSLEELENSESESGSSHYAEISVKNRKSRDNNNQKGKHKYGRKKSLNKPPNPWESVIEVASDGEMKHRKHKKNKNYGKISDVNNQNDVKHKLGRKKNPLNESPNPLRRALEVGSDDEMEHRQNKMMELKNSRHQSLNPSKSGFEASAEIVDGERRKVMAYPKHVHTPLGNLPRNDLYFARQRLPPYPLDYELALPLNKVPVTNTRQEIFPYPKELPSQDMSIYTTPYNNISQQDFSRSLEQFSQRPFNMQDSKAPTLKQQEPYFQVFSISFFI